MQRSIKSWVVSSGRLSNTTWPYRAKLLSACPHPITDQHPFYITKCDTKKLKLHLTGSNIKLLRFGNFKTKPGGYERWVLGCVWSMDPVVPDLHPSVQLPHLVS